MIPECLPGLISSMTTALTTILGYSAMSGAHWRRSAWARSPVLRLLPLPDQHHDRLCHAAGAHGAGVPDRGHALGDQERQAAAEVTSCPSHNLSVSHPLDSSPDRRASGEAMTERFGQRRLGQGKNFNVSIPRPRSASGGELSYCRTNLIKEYVAMNRDTICVQGGYTPGNGEPRQIPHHPVHHLQVRHQRGHGQAVRPASRRLLSIPACRTPPAILKWPKRICELEGGTAAIC